MKISAELNWEREKVRLLYCSSGDDFSAACYFENLLRRFDKELRKRMWGMKFHSHRVFIENMAGIYLMMIKCSSFINLTYRWKVDD